MPYNRITNDDCRRIVHKVQKGWMTKAIAKALDLNYHTVFKIVKIFLATGEYLLKQQGGNRRSKISPEIKQKILKWVDNNCLLRLKDIRAKLIEVHDLEVSISTID